MKKQRVSNYAYQVNVIGSNQQRLASLEKATPQQLAMSDNPYQHCEHVHDEAYVDLLQQAEQAGLDITNAKYTDQRESLKQSYIECSASFEQEYETDTDYPIEDKDSQYLPGYDSSHTKLDARKAKLLNAYLLKPSHISAYGVYRPLSGKVSMVPTVAYNSRNLNIENSHFIYLDAKEQAVYFWADTFAYIFSSSFDKDLGLGMQDKWLKINLNDQSLPQGFIKDLIKTHIEAKDAMYANANQGQYHFLSLSELQNQSPQPNAKHLPYLKDASLIVEQNVTEEEYNQDMQLYLTALYDQMTEKYPQLIQSSQNSEEGDDSTETETKDSYSSLSVFKKIFQGIASAKSRLKESAIEEDRVANSISYTVNPKVEYAVRDHSMPEDKWLWRNVYGLDKQQHIIWHLAQRRLGDADDSSFSSGDLFKGLHLEYLTRYSDITATTPMFDSLPAGASLPNNSNSIDMQTYLQQLKLKYRNGEGTEQGKMIFQIFP